MYTRLFVILAILCLSGNALNAQSTDLSQPPYLVHSSTFIMTLFKLNAEDVQAFLPSGVKAKVGDDGMVTGGLEMYETDRIHGTPNYAMVFIFVEVLGLDSNNGTPGHWAIWGRVNQRATLKNMQHYFNFPYQIERITVKESAGAYTGTVGDGLISLTIKQNDKAPFSGEGIVNMCSASNDGKIVLSEVPWFSKGYAGELVSFEIKANGSKILERVQGSKPFFSMVSTDQTFSYSRAVHQ